MDAIKSNKAIDRAEKVAMKLEKHRLSSEAIKESKGFKKPRSLRRTPIVKKRAKVKRYEFTEAQLAIARRSLNARGSV